MKNINDILFIVQARLNSTRIPNKMIRKFGDTTLLDICFQKLLNSKIIPKKQLYASLYEDKLKEIAQKYNINIFNRSSESANNENDSKCMLEWYNKLDYKYVVLISACSPLLNIETIDNFIENYINHDFDGQFGVIKKKNYFFNKNGDMISTYPDNLKSLNTKYVDITYEAGHSLYASKCESIGKGIWMGTFKKKNDPVLYELNENETFDIDYEWQFNMAELYYIHNKKKIL
tara:strand:- start:75 stop:770 length:696 start_codon:yes stop_codon:yes gene_type:complete